MGHTSSTALRGDYQRKTMQTWDSASVANRKRAISGFSNVKTVFNELITNSKKQNKMYFTPIRT